MPPIAPGAVVLVTGANGFIAAWVIRALLEAGYFVRGTVRGSPQRGAYLAGQLPVALAQKLDICVVGDNTEDGAYDEVVKGVDAVAHLASPLPRAQVKDVKEIVDPAVKGTTGILQSIMKNGSKVKRVLVLSSTAAIAESGKNKIFDEKDWNQQALDEIADKGAGAGPHLYRASKTLAERAAWKMYDAVKDSVSWDMTVLNPPWVFGPTMHEVPHPEALNMSSHKLYDALLVEGALSPAALSSDGSGWVDVRDLAAAHVRALGRADAGGERIIVSQGSFVWQDFVDAARTLHPQDARLVKGGTQKNHKLATHFDTAVEARVLNLVYRGIEETTRDVFEDYKKHGWW